MRTLNFVIEGKIPTMKNQQRIGISNTGKRYVYHPKEVEQYKKDAFYQLKDQLNRNYQGEGFDIKVSLSAVYFLKKDKDLNNVNAIVWDCLQTAGVIANDSQVIANRETKIESDQEKVYIRVKSYQADDFNLNTFMRNFEEELANIE